MSTKEEIAELRAKYKELTGKNASPAWNTVEKLQEKIDSYSEEDSESTEKEAGLEVFNGVEIDPNKDYTFRLKHKSNPRSIMPREAKVWDEETGSTRSIRLSSVEASPYLDEQDPEAPIDATTPIFNNGYLTISGMDAPRLRFMLAFDGYDKKKKVLPNNQYVKDMYELVDEVKEDKNKLEISDARIDAQLIIRKAADKDIANFVRSVYLQPVEDWTADAVKAYAYEQAAEDPYIVLKEFTDPKHAIKVNVQKMFAKGLITDDNNMIKWKDTNGVIMTYGDDVRADDALVKFVLVGDKDAKAFKERMEAKLSE